MNFPEKCVETSFYNLLLTEPYEYILTDKRKP